MQKLPALVHQSGFEEKSFHNEREILYQILFDMRKDISDLKKVVNDLSGGHYAATSDVIYTPTIIQSDSYTNPQSAHIHDKTKDYPDMDDVEAIHEEEESEESKSMADMERDFIVKKLEKHKGKRKIVADELQISERTLYRKIKDFGIDN